MQETDYYPFSYKSRSSYMSEMHSPMTIAEYIAFSLHTASIHTLFCSEIGYKSYLASVASPILPHSVISLESPLGAIQAAIAYAKNRGISAFLIGEEELLLALQDIVMISEEKLPIIGIITTASHYPSSSTPLHIETPQRKAISHIKTLLETISGSYLHIQDRRTAGARIDRAFDVIQELGLFSILEISEEVSHTFLPPHIYRKTIFNHEEEDLFFHAWATLFFRLHHASEPVALIIGKQIRKKEWMQILIQIGHQWKSHLFIDPSIIGILSADEVGIYRPIYKRKHHAKQIFSNYTTLFCFGVEAEHIWMQTFLEEISLQDETYHDIMSINATELFFGEGHESFQLFSLEHFFQSTPNISDTLWMNHGKKHCRNPIQESQLPYTPSLLQSLMQSLHTFDKASKALCILDLLQDEIEQFYTYIPNSTIWEKPKYADVTWIITAIIGILESREKEIILVSTKNKALLESLLEWWDRTSYLYSTAKLVLIVYESFYRSVSYPIVELENSSTIVQWLNNDQTSTLTPSIGFIKI